MNLFSVEETTRARQQGAGEEGAGLLTASDFEVYGRIIRQLKQLVGDTFQYPQLHFTAPTFITRLDGDTEWEPQGEEGV